MSEISPELQECFDHAEKVVASWPKWKQLLSDEIRRNHEAQAKAFDKPTQPTVEEKVFTTREYSPDIDDERLEELITIADDEFTELENNVAGLTIDPELYLLTRDKLKALEDYQSLSSSHSVLVEEIGHLKDRAEQFLDGPTSENEQARVSGQIFAFNSVIRLLSKHNKHNTNAIEEERSNELQSNTKG